MPDTEPLVLKSPHHVTYINQVFITFISSIGDYIRTDLFPRAKDTVISTHSKAVEMIRNRKNIAGENWAPQFPFLVINPDLNFLPEQQSGRFFHNYPNYNIKLGSKLYAPRIYEDDDLYIATNLTRYEGDIEVICWCSSVYDLIDTRINIINMFSGLNRIITPRNIDCVVIIPDYLANYTYTNNYTEQTKTLDWTGLNYVSSQIIKNINQEKLTYTMTLRPNLKLMSIDDASTDQYGGSSNNLTDHKLVMQLHWECNIPTHLFLIERKMPTPSVPITFEISHKMNYIPNPIDITQPIEIRDEIFSTAVTDIDTTSISRKFLNYSSSENYFITAEDVVKFNNNENVRITPSVTLTDSRYLRIYGKYGHLKEPIHYDVDTDTGEIKLYGQNLKSLEEDDILIFIYYSDSQI